MRPVTSVKKSPPMPMREVIATRVERPLVGRVLLSAMPGPSFADVEALAWFEGPEPCTRYTAGRQHRRVWPHRLRLHTDPFARRVDDDRVQTLVVFDLQVEVGPPQYRWARGLDVDVIEPA